ncbi:uncharacterized protein [Drosophila kikkawai]|uniref:Protein TsetseEP domain-containing protein n=1 Tax=Drosophila kikkawai TaxID=30033 RepID=A0A6P4I788_DROKI|nr:uncharacterized protein LOC108072902 [Drosophila kikkawai]
MHSLTIAILLAALAFSYSATSPRLFEGPSKVFQLLSVAGEMQQINPGLTAPCFAYYEGIFNKEYEVYRAAYNECINQFSAGKNGVLERYDGIVWSLGNSTYDSCQALIKCNTKDNSLDSLNCYSTQGTDNSEEVANIASNATISAGSLSQEISQLEYTRDLCTNTTSRNYDISYDASYEEFQSCLSGESAVPVSNA